jgi:maleate isomerase
MNIAISTRDPSLENSTGYARARIGLIIPSSNRLTEPQFRRFLPGDVAVHTTRLRMTGKHSKPLAALLDDVAAAAGALGDAKCDVIVFHCTANSMEHGPEGEREILKAIRDASGAEAMTTAQAVVQALHASNIKKLVMISPYQQSHNDHEKDYLAAMGFETIHDVALGLPPSDGYLAYPPSRWIDCVRDNIRDDADGYFLSCTNTTQIDTIATLEPELGKPVLNSNQATIWAALKRLSDKIGGMPAIHELGGLMNR